MFTHQDIIHAESERQTAMIANEPLASPTPSAPSLSPASNGFWWLWHEGEWCVAKLRWEELKLSIHFSVLIVREKKPTSHACMTPCGIQENTWGGRITPPAKL